MNRVINGTSVVPLVIALAILPGFAQTSTRRHDNGKVLWAPPPIDLPDEHPASSVPREMIASLQVGSTQIVLNKTSRAEAQKALGGTVGKQGDAGDSEAWICYHGRNSDGRWMLWLLSGEIDSERVSGFQWIKLSPGQTPDNRCKRIPGDSPVKLPIAIRPGMGESELRGVLGEPTLVSGNLLEYSYEHDQKLDQVDYTVTNDVNLVLEEGRVRALQVWRSEVN